MNDPKATEQLQKPWQNRADLPAVAAKHRVPAAIACFVCALVIPLATNETYARILTAVLFVCVVFFVRTRTHVGITLVAALLISLVLGFSGAAVFLAIVLGIALTAYLITIFERSYLAVLLPLLAFGAAYLWTRDLLLSSAALIFLPAAILLAVATLWEKGRTTAICFAIAGLLISALAITAVMIDRTQGGLTSETIRSAVENGREFVVTQLISARDSLLAATSGVEMDEQMREAYDQLRVTMSDDVLRTTVGILFNVVPALVTMLCSILAFLAQMILNATYRRTGLDKVLTPAATTFTMSGTAAVLYMIAFVLILLVSDSTMAGAVIQNVALILTPGFCVMGIYDLRQMLLRMRNHSRMWFVIFLGASLCLCSGASALYVLAMWGAYGVVMHLLKEKLMQKMQDAAGGNHQDRD